MAETLWHLRQRAAMALPAPGVEVLKGALVAPMAAGSGMACGVFRSDGSFCETSRTMLSAPRLSARPERPAATGRLAGKHLFAGIWRHHFGHFLMECACRLWPLGRDTTYAGLIVIAKAGRDINSVAKSRLGAFVDLLSVGLPVTVVTQPVEVEELVVPTQGMGHRHWSAGTEVFRQFMRDQIRKNVRPAGPDRLYVSRGKLKRPSQLVHNERRIERLMRRAGYSVFHPQNHSIEKQCARYLAARKIVGADGSAFHLVPMALQAGTTVGLIKRRNRPEVFTAIAAQIEAFAPQDLVIIDALAQDAPAPQSPLTAGPLPPRGEVAKINFKLLKKQLEEAGLI